MPAAHWLSGMYRAKLTQQAPKKKPKRNQKSNDPEFDVDGEPVPEPEPSKPAWVAKSEIMRKKLGLDPEDRPWTGRPDVQLCGLRRQLEVPNFQYDQIDITPPKRPHGRFLCCDKRQCSRRRNSRPRSRRPRRRSRGFWHRHLREASRGKLRHGDLAANFGLGRAKLRPWHMLRLHGRACLATCHHWH